MIRLRTDGHIDITLNGGQEVVLNPPTVDEWRQIVVAYNDADDEVKQRASGNPPAEDGLPGGPTVRQLYGATADEGAPYAIAFARVLDLLSVSSPDADKLPAWTGRGDLFAVLYRHWRGCDVEVEGDKPAVPFSPSPQAGAVPTIDLDALGDVPAAPTPPPAGGITATGQLTG